MAGEAGVRTAVLVEVEYSQQPTTQARSYGSPLVPWGVEVVVWRALWQAETKGRT